MPKTSNHDRPVGWGPALCHRRDIRQSLDRTLEIVDVGAAHGADMMKLDVRLPGFVIDDPKSLWAGRQLYELYKEAHTPRESHRPIMERAATQGVHCFSTPFDETAVDFRESLGVPDYKIALFENTDLPLIRRVASTGRPVRSRRRCRPRAMPAAGTWRC